MNFSFILILVFFLLGFSCTSNSDQPKFKTNNLFLHTDSVFTDTLSVVLLGKYQFFNRQELSGILTGQTKAYQYGQCGMGILDMNDQENKVLQFLSNERSTLPRFNFDDIETIFALPGEFNVSNKFDLKTISTHIKVDTLSEMPNIIMNFAFIDQKSQDTVGYQWTNLYEWKRLGTTVILYKTQKDFEELYESIGLVVKEHDRVDGHY